MVHSFINQAGQPCTAL